METIVGEIVLVDADSAAAAGAAAAARTARRRPSDGDKSSRATHGLCLGARCSQLHHCRHLGQTAHQLSQAQRDRQADSHRTAGPPPVQDRHADYGRRPVCRTGAADYRRVEYHQPAGHGRYRPEHALSLLLPGLARCAGCGGRLAGDQGPARQGRGDEPPHEEWVPDSLCQHYCLGALLWPAAVGLRRCARLSRLFPHRPVDHSGDDFFDVWP